MMVRSRKAKFKLALFLDFGPEEISANEPNLFKSNDGNSINDMILSLYSPEDVAEESSRLFKPQHSIRKRTIEKW